MLLGGNVLNTIAPKPVHEKNHPNNMSKMENINIYHHIKFEDEQKILQGDKKTRNQHTSIHVLISLFCIFSHKLLFKLNFCMLIDFICSIIQTFG